MKSFDNYPSFEESIEPGKQFKNLFRKNDRELKKVFLDYGKHTKKKCLTK